jgi:hypothetical protein
LKYAIERPGNAQGTLRERSGDGQHTLRERPPTHLGPHTNAGWLLDARTTEDRSPRRQEDEVHHDRKRRPIMKLRRLSFAAILPLLCACAGAGAPGPSLPDPYEHPQTTLLLQMAVEEVPPLLDVGEEIRLRPVWKCALRNKQWRVNARWPVRWSSGDPRVAAVSEDGVLRAGAPGWAVVRGIREARGKHWVQADTVDLVVRVRGADGDA